MNHSNGKNIVYIGTGSNIGDGLANCRAGIALLAGHPSVTMEECSHFYHTAPMDYADQPWFINAVFRIRTDLSAFALLDALKSAETGAGRPKSGIRFGPRVLDFDIIFFNDDIIDTADLVVPHPRMHCREFVLRPLCDLSPELMHPVLKRNMRELLAEAAAPEHPCVRIPETG